MINGYFDLPAETVGAMKEIRELAQAYADGVARVVKTQKHDVGRVIAAIDLIQSSKDVACASLILPHASVDDKE